MKTLLVVRHAKSSWADAGTSDIDRPLDNRGKKDAPEMAKRLRKRDIQIDLFLSSPALRAYSTAQYFADVHNVNKQDIVIAKKLYNASLESFYEVVAALSDACNNVMLFSHNPGITDFVNSLSHVHTDNMPACAVYAVAADTDTWAGFEKANKQFLFFDYPKNLLD